MGHILAQNIMSFVVDRTQNTYFIEATAPQNEIESILIRANQLDPFL